MAYSNPDIGPSDNALSENHLDSPVVICGSQFSAQCAFSILPILDTLSPVNFSPAILVHYLSLYGTRLLHIVSLCGTHTVFVPG